MQGTGCIPGIDMGRWKIPMKLLTRRVVEIYFGGREADLG